MSFAAQLLRSTVRKVLYLQLGFVSSAALAYFFTVGGGAASAALFGGMVALLNTFVSAHRLHKASEAASNDPRRGMFELYLGAITRFFATPALIALGIAGLDLDPVAIIVGFGTAQLAFFFGGVAAQPPRIDSKSTGGVTK